MRGPLFRILPSGFWVENERASVPETTCGRLVQYSGLWEALILVLFLQTPVEIEVQSRAI